MTNQSTPHTHADLDDKALVQLCKQNDDQAFRHLVQRHQRKLFSVALGMVHNQEDALEVVQEGFLKAHRYLPKFEGNSSFYTWIYRIVMNLCIDFLRKGGKYNLEYNDAIQHQKENQAHPIATSSVSPSPSQALKNKELGQQIWHAIQSLSENHRAVIILRELEGMSYEQMAQTLDCSKGTVMSRLHHARAHLKQQLEQYIQAGKKVSPKPKRNKNQKISSYVEVSGDNKV